MRIFRWLVVVIQNDSYRRRIQVIKLARTDRPEKRPHCATEQQQRQRDQDVQNTHDYSNRLRRNAFSTTISELALIPIAAAHGGTIPIAASGNAVAL